VMVARSSPALTSSATIRRRADRCETSPYERPRASASDRRRGWRSRRTIRQRFIIGESWESHGTNRRPSRDDPFVRSARSTVISSGSGLCTTTSCSIRSISSRRLDDESASWPHQLIDALPVIDEIARPPHLVTAASPLGSDDHPRRSTVAW